MGRRDEGATKRPLCRRDDSFRPGQNRSGHVRKGSVPPPQNQTKPSSANQRGCGTQCIVADVLAENDRMLALARELGFEVGEKTVHGTRCIGRAL